MMATKPQNHRAVSAIGVQSTEAAADGVGSNDGNGCAIWSMTTDTTGGDGGSSPLGAGVGQLSEAPRFSSSANGTRNFSDAVSHNA